MNRLTRVCALTSGRNAPASRFRVRQHICALRTLGYDVREHCPIVPQAMPLPGALPGLRRRHLAPLSALWTLGHVTARIPGILASRNADLVWIERTIVPGLDEIVRLIGRPRVLDADDAVWLEGATRRSIRTLARSVDSVVAGNSYLADWFSQHCSIVHTIPTAIDCQRFHPRQDSGQLDGFRILWTGTSGNFRYLGMLRTVLRRVLQEVPAASITIVADRAPELAVLGDLPVRFIRWRESVEADALQGAHVGVMPLTDDEWTRGKCSFKMLQYMASGLPCVVSPVGMNRDVLARGACGLVATSESEWVDALVTLSRDADLCRQLGNTGRQIVEKHYDVPVIARQLSEVFAKFRNG